MVTVTQGDNLRTDGTAGPGPGGQADNQCDNGGAALLLADGVGDQDQQDEAGDNGEDVGDEHDEVVESTADVTGQQAHGQTDQGSDGTGDQADLNGGAGCGDQLLQNVTAEVVSAQGQGLDVGDLVDVDIVGLQDLLGNFQNALFILDSQLLFFAGEQGLNGAVQVTVVNTLSLGQTADGEIFGVVGSPDSQQGVGVFHIQIGNVNTGLGQPVDHGDPVLVLQSGGNTVVVSIGKTQGLGSGIQSVVQGNVSTGLCEGADTDHFQRIAGIDQGVNEGSQNDGNENGEANHKLGGVEQLLNCIFHKKSSPP